MKRGEEAVIQADEGKASALCRTMPKSKTSKPAKKPRHITARSITLVDAKGKARISLDAGDGGGFACIAVHGDNGTINICTQPNGSVVIGMMRKRRSGATFSVGPQGHGALTVQTPEGMTFLGAVGEDGEHVLRMCRRRKGTGDDYGVHELSFEAPSPPRKRKAKSSPKRK
jgi:hypothetical protein